MQSLNLNLSEASGCQIWAPLMRLFKKQWGGFAMPTGPNSNPSGQVPHLLGGVTPRLAGTEEGTQRTGPGDAGIKPNRT